MKIKEFVSSCLKLLKDVRSTQQKFPKEDVSSLIELESERRITRFLSLLNNYQDSEMEVNEDTLKPFTDFMILVGRSMIDLEKNSIYTFSYYSHANQFFINLADRLSKITSYRSYELLLPTLQNRHYDFNEPLNSMILSDDHRTLINVAMALKDAHLRHSDILKHTHPMDDLNLTQSEIYRVINHTSVERDYFVKIKTSEKKIKKIEKKLNEQQGNAVPEFGYGQPGYLKVNDDLYGNLSSKQNLVDTLLEFPADMWEKYLNNIDVKILREYLLNGQNIDQACSDISQYQIDDHSNRALLFLYFYLYRLELGNRDAQYLHYLGYFFGKSKDEALHISSIPYNFLKLGCSLSQFPEYIDLLKKLKLDIEKLGFDIKMLAKSYEDSSEKFDGVRKILDERAQSVNYSDLLKQLSSLELSEKYGKFKNMFTHMINISDPAYLSHHENNCSHNTWWRWGNA